MRTALQQETPLKSTANTKNLSRASKVLDASEGWVGLLVFPAGLASLIMVFVGHEDLLRLFLLGRRPETLPGFWGAVMLVAISTWLSAKLRNDTARLRLEIYTRSGMHWPSVLLALLAATVAGCVELMSYGSTLYSATGRAFIASGSVWIVIAQPWWAKWRSEWDREHAHKVQMTRYRVEGRDDGQANWSTVLITDDVSKFRDARSLAHAQFDRVRWWTEDSLVTFHNSYAAGGMLFAEAEETKGFSRQEAEAAFRK